MTETKTNIDIVFCINVFKLPDFLKQQIQTITDNVLCSHVIVLNCNEYMFHELNNEILPTNVYINPEVINKEYCNGAFTHGIVSNIEYAHTKFIFKYCIILSGRTIFYKNITLPDLEILNKKWSSLEEKEASQKGNFPDINWRWPSLRNTLLAKHYISLGYKLYCSEHEGLCISYSVSVNILDFLNNHLEIKNDLFNFNNAVEEFSLQTISSNEVDITNLEYGYINLGHGVTEDYDLNKVNKYTRKIPFPE